MPFGLFSIFAALYMALYTLYSAGSYLVTRTLDIAATGIGPSFEIGTPDLFYLNTSVLLILIAIVLSFTISLIFIGKRMSESVIGFRHLFSYLILYGFIAPIWLAKAVIGATRGTISAWR